MNGHLQAYRKICNKLLTDYHHAQRLVVSERKHQAEAREHAAAVLEAQQLVQQVAEQVQVQAHQQIATVVTRCLKAVFGEESYEFIIDFQRLRGRTSAHLWFVRDGERLDPIEATGGGVVDVASFALRLAALVLTQPRRRRLLVLDEPLKHLSAAYRPAIRELLPQLAKELGIQIIMTTHSAEFMVGKVIAIG